MAQEEKIKVLIVDDHQIVRQGLRAFLELHEDIIVVGEAGDGRTAVEATRLQQPDIVLMDLVMPNLDGIEATRQITSLSDTIKIIALTSFADDDKIFPAIQAGASSYLLKDISPDDLIGAIRAAYRGEARLHPNVVRALMDAARNSRHDDSTNKPTETATNLTERELDVTRLVAQGRSNRDIAKALFISEKTVKTHVSNILDKLNLKDRTQLAIYAIKQGLA
ncbi:MAG: response regulator transcription factor [Anaerolineae bacterium]|nr:response regulator transcription factor [Anaerolineae bacterium]MBL8104178.1 response regulator transcription factor [Anaerolineales bacterium]MCC7191129.1 response regulator transcription factor [Anaerolineales bacterium]